MYVAQQFSPKSSHAGSENINLASDRVGVLNLIAKIQTKFNFVYELKPQLQQISYFLHNTVRTYKIEM